jgi:hypothetical protein
VGNGAAIVGPLAARLRGIAAPQSGQAARGGERGLAPIALALSGFYRVEPDELGVAQCFGKYVFWPYGLFSFLSTDKKKTYCLYEAPNAEAIRVAAHRPACPPMQRSKSMSWGPACSVSAFPQNRCGSCSSG